MKAFEITTIVVLIVTISWPSEGTLTDGNRKFTVKFFQQIIKNARKQNVVFSPMSIQIVMALFTSATNRTPPAIQEILTKLELPFQKETLHDEFKSLTQKFKNIDDDFRFFDANRMYLGSGSEVKDWFNTLARDTYNADTAIINFGSPKDAANTINKWVSERTDKNIKDLIEKDQLSANTKLLLVNALYLSGKWSTTFTTVEDGWFGLGSHKKQVKMMRTKKNYYYFEDTDAQYLQISLDRDGGNAEMFFVLPTQADGIDNLINNNLDKALTAHKFTVTEVSVSIPKFEITSDIDVKPILTQLGVDKVFREGVKLEAYSSKGVQFNSITNFVQKAMIQISERGVTAIAATESETTVDGLGKIESKDFNADHPFLFYIRVDEVIVYAGLFMEPL